MFSVFDLLNGARMTPQYADACLANGVPADAPELKACR